MVKPMRSAITALWVGLGLLAYASLGHGHAFAPALLEFNEQPTGQIAVRWKQPTVQVAGSALQPLLPPNCQTIDRPAVFAEGTGAVLSWNMDCADSLVGQTIEVSGIARSRADVLLRIQLADGHVMQQVLTPDQPAYTVPERETLLDIMLSYGQLGVEHILSGFDHLLFVLALILLIHGVRLLVWTITAFTIGHSITLALAVLGVVQIPQQPVEWLIALSIFFLAVELARRTDDIPTLLQRRPWLVAGLFGLLHGLGFAGALREVGLPEGDIPLALVSFNLGIEVGQLAFVGVVLVALLLLRMIPLRWPMQSFRPIHIPAYFIGSLAAFWCIERGKAFLG